MHNLIIIIACGSRDYDYFYKLLTMQNVITIYMYHVVQGWFKGGEMVMFILITVGRTAREDIVRYFTKIHCGVSLILLKLIMWGLH